MAKQLIIWAGIGGILVVSWGCVSSVGTYQGAYKYNNYSNSDYYSNTVNNSHPWATSQRQSQVVTQPVYSFTDPGATGEGFQKEYAQTMKRDRERNINTYLRSCGMWGGTVLELREQMLVAIEAADKQLVRLRTKIILAGGSPDADANYIAAKKVRDNLALKLRALDNRVMEAIVSKATGDVAKRLIWREDDKVSAQATLSNLEHGVEWQNNETQSLLEKANW